MSEAVVEMECRGEEGVVFMGVASRDCLAGAPGGDYPSRAIVKCSGAPIADTAFMGLTSCRWITIARTLARRQRVAQPASWSQPSNKCRRVKGLRPRADE